MDEAEREDELRKGTWYLDLRFDFGEGCGPGRKVGVLIIGCTLRVRSILWG